MMNISHLKLILPSKKQQLNSILLAPLWVPGKTVVNWLEQNNAFWENVYIHPNLDEEYVLDIFCNSEEDADILITRSLEANLECAFYQRAENDHRIVKLEWYPEPE